MQQIIFDNFVLIFGNILAKRETARPSGLQRNKWFWGKSQNQPKFRSRTEKGQNLDEIVEMRSLIRLIPSAERGGWYISRKEYYYACVQDVGSRYINSSCLYVESATVLFVHNSVPHNHFVGYSIVQQIRDGSNLAAQWILLVAMSHQRIWTMASISSRLREFGISSYHHLNPTSNMAQPKSIGGIFEAYHDRTRVQ